MINFENPITLIKENPEEFHKRLQTLKFQQQVSDEYEKYKAIVDEDPNVKEQIRKIDILISKTDNRDIRSKLICKKIELNMNKMYELIMEDFNKATTQEEYKKLYCVILEMGNRINL